MRPGTAALLTAVVLSLALAAGASAQDGPAPVLAAAAPAAGAPRDEGRRTLQRLPANLGRGFVGVFARESLKPLVVGAAATGVVSLFDAEVRDAIANPDADFGKFGETAGGPVAAVAVAGVFVAGRFAGDLRFRAASYDLANAALVTQGYVALIKLAVGRDRPCCETMRIGSSFPSGHTATIMTIASVLDRHYGWKIAAPAYAFAAFVAVSRLQHDEHYLSDVVAGATLGFIVGRTVVRMNNRPLSASGSTRARSISVSPRVSRRSGGVSVLVVF